ncbi:ATP-binding protein [Kitasatospora sp. NBC_01287]|uniref:ATP-binding protein n=1 Tax=Kitasatospora sp. NBC_01287 TaxID=2903573 RepID=UPI00224D7A6D|nr:ATP-binding protein [Kitasatospora sp. NBC_01287]MCX4747021.1 ATP-binding protein [Kitasatospora sp. NBC_01287]
MADELVATDTCWLPRRTNSPARARRLLGELLRGVKGGERFHEVGQLVVSELVTNALVHGTRSGQLIWIELKVDHEQLWIAVEDASSAVPRVCRAADGETGRGMLLVEELTLAWGCGPREGIGKRVWVIVGPDQK